MNKDRIIKEKAHGVVLETSCQIVTDEIQKHDVFYNALLDGIRSTIFFHACAGMSALSFHSLLNEPGCSFLFCVGKGKRLVKRKEFEKFIEKTLEV